MLREVTLKMASGSSKMACVVVTVALFQVRYRCGICLELEF